MNALRILDSANIPKFIDSNLEYFEDLKVELFMVSEYIPGPTLEKYINKAGQMDFDTALALCIKIAEVLAHCHKEGIYHRDVKPDNIILREGNPNAPVLIDFGLSFNADEKFDLNVTPGWEQIGNRFLLLPEFRVAQSNKRDPRSDVTMVVGLFIYTVTGEEPSVLEDGTKGKPHQRQKEKAILEKLPERKLKILNLIFDIGFNTDINTRWQSVESLLEYLKDLSKTGEEEKEMNIEEKLRNIKKTIEDTPEYKKVEEIDDILSRVGKTILSGFNRAYVELDKKVFVAGMTRPRYEEGKYTRGLCHGIHNKGTSKSFYPTVVYYLNGNEIVIEARESGNRTEIMRFPVAQEVDEKRLE